MTLPSTGDLGPCPHCGAKSRAEQSAALRWRCGVCGHPLVPSPPGVPRSNGELPALLRTHRLRAMALGWTAAAFVLGAIAMMGTGVALLVWLASHAAGIVLGVLAVASLAGTFASVRRARQRRTQAHEELDTAWDAVAGEVLAARSGDTTAADLAGAMQTDETHAERMLARLSALGRARVDVRDDAELAYRVSEAAPEEEAEAGAAPRMRAR